VTVVKIRGNRVWLGIESPQGTPVWREELVGDSGLAVA